MENNIEEIIEDLQYQVDCHAPKDGDYEIAAAVIMDIKQAKEVIQALQSAPKWLNYPENRPVFGKQYFVADENKFISKMYAKPNNTFEFYEDEITHFMEIPEIK